MAQKCWNGGTRGPLTPDESIRGRVRCSRCGRVLKVRVPQNPSTERGSYEATLPHHYETEPTRASARGTR
jgi:hypothetical protein